MAECPQLLLRAWIWVGGGFVLLGGQNLLVTHHSEAMLDPLGPNCVVDHSGQGVLRAEALAWSYTCPTCVARVLLQT